MLFNKECLSYSEDSKIVSAWALTSICSLVNGDEGNSFDKPRKNKLLVKLSRTVLSTEAYNSFQQSILAYFENTHFCS